MSDSKTVYSQMLKASIVASLIISASVYISHKTSRSVLAGLILGIPVALPSLWYIQNKDQDKMKDYIKGYTVSMIIYFFVVLFFYYGYVKLNYEKKNMILFAVGTWFMLACIYYFMFFKKS